MSGLALCRVFGREIKNWSSASNLEGEFAKVLAGLNMSGLLGLLAIGCKF